MSSITQAPLPKWGDLLCFLLNKESDKELASLWVRPGDLSFWLSRSTWSFAALVEWRKRLTNNKTVSIWFPDFFCNDPLKILKRIGANINFYPVNNEMQPNYRFCLTLADINPLDIFVFVHFLGQSKNVQPFFSFCRQRGAWLIEDATHVLKPISGVGEFGDCVLYSPHKQLPIPDGAVLVIRPNGPSHITEDQNALNILSQVLACLFSGKNISTRFSVIWLAKRIAQKLGIRRHAIPEPFKVGRESNKLKYSTAKMSYLAKRLLVPQRKRLIKIEACRKSNVKKWFKFMSLLAPDIQLFQHQLDGAPYLASFSGKDIESTESMYYWMVNCGLPATTWPNLPDDVLTDSKAHADAIALRNSLIHLPIHENISTYKISKYLCKAIKELTRKWKTSELRMEDWECYWKQCQNTNMLQSWQYGETKKKAEKWTPHRLLISDSDSIAIAIVQVLTKKIPMLGHLARINRGPILIHKQSTKIDVSNYLKTLSILKETCHTKKWRILKIAPELPDTTFVSTSLKRLGFKKIKNKNWASARLNLKQNKDTLLQNLDGKWRNCLKKGIKMGVIVTKKDTRFVDCDDIINNYEEFQSEKTFTGISSKLLRELLKQHGEQWNCHLFVAHVGVNGGYEKSKRLGLLLAVRAGDTSTYLVGTTSEEGRRMQANSVLLWNAVESAKDLGCAWFDIGGLSISTPTGITKFKRGLNADPYALAGEWWNIFV